MMYLVIAEPIVKGLDECEWSKRFDEWRSLTAEYQKKPTDVNRDLLALTIRNMARGWGGPPEELQAEKTEVQEEMIEVLMGNPENLLFFESEIKEAKRKWSQSDQSSYEERKEYYSRCENSISILGFLPDPRSVRVLGELLTDTQAFWTSEGEEVLGPNCRYAMAGLKSLIEDGPESSDDPIYGKVIDRNAWIHWYDQVKSGNRTFRFRGSDQFYSLQGPVDKALGSYLEPGSLPTRRDSIKDRFSRNWESHKFEKRDAKLRGFGLIYLGVGFSVIVLGFIVYKKIHDFKVGRS